MKRLIIFGILVIFTIIKTFSYQHLEVAKTYLDNQPLPIKAIIYKGRGYLPQALLEDYLNVKITWSASERVLKVNGVIIINAEPIFRYSTKYFPVAPIARAANLLVYWDKISRTIKIVHPKNFSYLKDKKEKTTHVNIYNYNYKTIKTNTNVVPSNPPTKNEDYKEVPQANFFIPKTSSNEVYTVTVSDLQEAKLIKNYYKPKTNYKFIIIHLSQQNISNNVQIYTGKFYLIDNKGNSYEYLENLSNYWLQVLRPGGINFGSLVYEIPIDRKPAKLMLQTYGASPLVIDLY